MSSRSQQSSFQVGDRVKVDFGRHKLTGVVVEDRGPIGVRGRRLFQVEIPMDPFEPMRMELPEDEMEPVGADETPSSIDKQRIIDYLTHGGLISILRSNLAGGRNQPQAWLCLDQLGNVTHTFVPERGIVGGQIVPSHAVHDAKVFTPKRDSVLAFVESFGLDRQEAEAVVSQVGTAR